jgi:hypothetical protein
MKCRKRVIDLAFAKGQRLYGRLDPIFGDQSCIDIGGVILKLQKRPVGHQQSLHLGQPAAQIVPPGIGRKRQVESLLFDDGWEAGLRIGCDVGGKKIDQLANPQIAGGIPCEHRFQPFIDRLAGGARSLARSGRCG